MLKQLEQEIRQLIEDLKKKDDKTNLVDVGKLDAYFTVLLLIKELGVKNVHNLNDTVL